MQGRPRYMKGIPEDAGGGGVKTEAARKRRRGQERTAGEEAEADEHGEDVAHAQDVVEEVGGPEEQRGGDAEGGEVGKVVQLGPWGEENIRLNPTWPTCFQRGRIPQHRVNNPSNFRNAGKPKQRDKTDNRSVILRN